MDFHQFFLRFTYIRKFNHSCCLNFLAIKPSVCQAKNSDDFHIEIGGLIYFRIHVFTAGKNLRSQSFYELSLSHDFLRCIPYPCFRWIPSEKDFFNALLSLVTIDLCPPRIFSFSLSSSSINPGHGTNAVNYPLIRVLNMKRFDPTSMENS